MILPMGRGGDLTLYFQYMIFHGEVMRKSALLLLFGLLLAACQTAFSTSITPTAMLSGSDQEISNRLDTFLTTTSTDPTFVGTELGFVGSVLVAREGKVLLSKGYGLANREMNLPNIAQTKFRLASVTKQFTAMAILILQARGKIDVQDRVCDYVPNCPLAWQAITLHHLLTHTSGIPDYYSSPDWGSFQGKPMTPADLMALFIDKPLDFQPGEKWKYSNSGYIVLGVIIEQVSGMTYEAFIKENIFGPLIMANTGYLDNPEDLAVGYSNATGVLPANFEDMSGLYAAGGLYSTVGDLYLWDQALYTDKLIPRGFRARMLTSYATVPDGGGFGYGYGWFIGEIADRRAIYHHGRIEGFTSLNLFYPDDKVIVIVLSNQWFMDPYRIGVQLANIVLE
jgi:CubicO group peptidase (beta-lactamase class C family)